MLELIRYDGDEIVFRHAYPKALGHLVFWMGVSFAVFDAYLLTWGLVDIPAWATFGLFVPCTIALLAAGAHVLRYAHTLRIDTRTHTYTERRIGLWGNVSHAGSMEEFGGVTSLGGDQAWLEAEERKERLVLRLSDAGSPDVLVAPTLRLECAEFADRIGLPLIRHASGFPVTEDRS